MPRITALPRRQTESDTMVVSKTDEGFRVYALSSPMDVYLVTGTAKAPYCNCPDFREFSEESGYECAHIRAAFQYGSEAGCGCPDKNQPPTANELSPDKPERVNSPNGKGATMLLKRSVSPDGRIDSLSVEISFPITRGKVGDLKLRAMKTLNLQGEIVEGFLSQNGRQVTEPDHSHENDDNGNGVPDGAEPARMIEIGGLNTKWGRRLFISFRVNGDMMKLFGSRKRLEEVLTAVGQAKLARRLDEGLKIDAACRVTTKESDDGRYTNIDQVYPAEGRQTARGRS